MSVSFGDLFLGNQVDFKTFALFFNGVEMSPSNPLFFSGVRLSTKTKVTIAISKKGD
jgi:hypothetical protein